MLMPRLRGRLMDAGEETFSAVDSPRHIGRNGRRPRPPGEGDLSGLAPPRIELLLLQLLLPVCRLTGVLQGELFADVFWCIVSAV